MLGKLKESPDPVVTGRTCAAGFRTAGWIQRRNWHSDLISLNFTVTPFLCSWKINYQSKTVVVRVCIRLHGVVRFEHVLDTSQMKIPALESLVRGSGISLKLYLWNLYFPSCIFEICGPMSAVLWIVKLHKLALAFLLLLLGVQGDSKASFSFWLVVLWVYIQWGSSVWYDQENRSE